MTNKGGIAAQAQGLIGIEATIMQRSEDTNKKGQEAYSVLALVENLRGSKQFSASNNMSFSATFRNPHPAFGHP